MKKTSIFIIGTVVLMFLLGNSIFAKNWIIDAGANNLPANFEATVQNANGTLLNASNQLGIAVVEFASESDVRALEANGWKVIPDVEIDWLPQGETSFDMEAAGINIGLDEPYYKYQWHLPVIQADKAWELGVKGAGVRVAVVDSGIWYYHSDLRNRVDLAASATFVPGTTSFVDDNGHGTHVAGIIAASDDARGTIGVAPEATLIAIKSMNSEGKGNVSWICRGIIHAVNQGADIINLSLGGIIKKSGVEGAYTASDAAAIHTLYNRVINWAQESGSLVVTAAGNEGLNFDQSRNYINLPAEAGNPVVVSATGPNGQQDFDRPASYSNYGSSLITVAAPGGDSVNTGPTGYYDMVLSTAIGYFSGPYRYDRWTFISGTSQASPMVSGVAALIISKYGKMDPGALRNHIAQTADDLGKKGRDDHYGRGRINAYKAVIK